MARRWESVYISGWMISANPSFQTLRYPAMVIKRWEGQGALSEGLGEMGCRA